MGGNFKKIVTFATKRFVRNSWHVRCLECPLLGGFTVWSILGKIEKSGKSAINEQNETHYQEEQKK